MESYTNEILLKKLINRILKCSSEYSIFNFEKFEIEELFNIQSTAFRNLLVNPSSNFNTQFKQTY